MRKSSFSRSGYLLLQVGFGKHYERATKCDFCARSVHAFDRSPVDVVRSRVRYDGGRFEIDERWQPARDTIVRSVEGNSSRSLFPMRYY